MKQKSPPKKNALLAVAGLAIGLSLPHTAAHAQCASASQFNVALLPDRTPVECRGGRRIYDFQITAPSGYTYTWYKLDNASNTSIPLLNGNTASPFVPVDPAAPTNLIIVFRYVNTDPCTNPNCQSVILPFELAPYDCSSDTPEYSKQQSMAYPNPVDGQLVVGDTDNAQLLSEKGVMIQELRVNNGNVTTKDLPNGSYILRLQKGKNVTTKRIQIQH